MCAGDGNFNLRNPLIVLVCSYLSHLSYRLLRYSRMGEFEGSSKRASERCAICRVLISFHLLVSAGCRKSGRAELPWRGKESFFLCVFRSEFPDRRSAGAPECGKICVG